MPNHGSYLEDLGFAVLAFWCACIAGCGGSGDYLPEGKCIANATRQCACPDGSLSTQTCEDGTGFSACLCGDEDPAFPSAGAGGGPGLPLGYEPNAQAGAGGNGQDPGTGTGGVGGAGEPVDENPLNDIPPADAPGDAPAGFPPVADYAARGPFPTSVAPEGPDCTVHRPAVLGEGGLRHPAIVWGNGTYTNPAVYAAVLDHWASHGFVVAAANTSNAGTGREMVACMEYLLAENGRPGSVYENRIDAARIGASGHSQGGGGSIMAGADPRISATAPLQPYTVGLGHDPSAQSLQSGPMFLMSGTNDGFAPPMPNQSMVFDNANVPVAWGTLQGADHLVSAMGDIGGYRGPATAWFRLHLMGDESARGLFYGPGCALCLNPAWEMRQKGL